VSQAPDRPPKAEPVLAHVAGHHELRRPDSRDGRARDRPPVIRPFRRGVNQECTGRPPGPASGGHSEHAALSHAQVLHRSAGPSHLSPGEAAVAGLPQGRTECPSRARAGEQDRADRVRRRAALEHVRRRRIRGPNRGPGPASIDRLAHHDRAARRHLIGARRRQQPARRCGHETGGQDSERTTAVRGRAPSGARRGARPSARRGSAAGRHDHEQPRRGETGQPTPPCSIEPRHARHHQPALCTPPATVRAVNS
jgi:hypothetical protein